VCKVKQHDSFKYFKIFVQLHLGEKWRNWRRNIKWGNCGHTEGQVRSQTFSANELRADLRSGTKFVAPVSKRLSFNPFIPTGRLDTLYSTKPTKDHVRHKSTSSTLEMKSASASFFAVFMFHSSGVFSLSIFGLHFSGLVFVFSSEIR